VSTVQEKKQKYFLHNFNKFRRIAVILGTHHRERTVKLLVERTLTSPNQYCYFTAQNDNVHVQRYFDFLHCLFFMDARRIFSRGGQIKVSGNGSFPVEFRAGTPVVVWGEVTTFSQNNA